MTGLHVTLGFVAGVLFELSPAEGRMNAKLPAGEIMEPLEHMNAHIYIGGKKLPVAGGVAGAEGCSVSLAILDFCVRFAGISASFLFLNRLGQYMHEYCFSDSRALDVRIVISHLQRLNGPVQELTSTLPACQPFLASLNNNHR